MINTVYELITDVMAKQYPDRVAFRYVAADEIGRASCRERV